MPQSERSDVIIVGAGIAGLTAALCLAQAGFSITIFERTKELKELGAGIQITPNASQVLINLGLEDALRAQSTSPETLEISSFNKRKPLVTMLLQNRDSPWFCLRRADLQNILLNAVLRDPDIILKLGRTIELFTQSDTGVIVKCRTTNDILQEYQAQILIGADGIWSSSRGFVTDSQPQFTGYEAWRALIPVDYATQKVQLYLGQGYHCVTYPVSQGKALNMVLIKKAKEPRDVAGRKNWSHKGFVSELQPILDSHITNLVQSVANWQVWSLYDMPVCTMAEGNIALMGDAAHPILPFLAQGAALAIEDAAVLAKQLKRAKDSSKPFTKALREYANIRQKRCQKVQSNARMNGRMYHLNWPLSLLRDKAITVLGAKGMQLKYNWLYDWKL